MDQDISQEPLDIVEDTNVPMSADVLPAAEALALLRQGKTLRNVRIEHLKLTGEFTQPIRMYRVLLIKPVFEKAVFKQDVVLSSCVLEQPAFLRKTEFAGKLNLSFSTLTSAVFQEVAFAGDVLARHTHWYSQMQVSKSQFLGKLNFWEAQFHSWVNFKECEFADQVDFRSSQAEQGLVYNGCKFQGEVLFRGTSVAKKWDGNGSHFAGLLDFSKAKLHDYVYLESIEQGEKHRLSFWNAVGERILIRPEQIAGKLVSELGGDYGQTMHEYAFLKRNFSALHRYEQEDWAFYQFKVNQRKATKRSWYRPWTKTAQFVDWLFLDQGCGYCTNPMRAVRTALLIMIVFALIYMVGFDKLHVDKVPFEACDKESWPNRIVVSLFLSVSVFTSGLSSIKDMGKDWVNIPLMIESLLGTLLWGLFIVAFSRKVIR